MDSEDLDNETTNDGQEETQDDAESSTGDLIETDPPDESVLRPVPVPPVPPGQQVQVALGMQLFQQSSFDRLKPSVQEKMVDLARRMDDHAFENAQESLRRNTELQRERLVAGITSRKHALFVLGGLAVLGLLAGTGVTLALIFQGKHELGHTVMMSGLAVVSALLGGAGLVGFFKKLSDAD